MGTRLGFPLGVDESCEIDVVVGQSAGTAEARVVAIEWEGEVALLASLRDVTQGKRSEAKFRGLLESAADAIVIVDDQRRVVLANSRAERLLGYTRSELLSLTVEALIPARFRQRHACHVTRFLGGPRARSMGAGLELFALRKDGREVPVEISLGPLESEEGMLVSVVIVDVSERKRAEQAVREADERFRQAFDEAPIGMAMLDRDRRFVRVNKALCEITGYSHERLEATSLEAITHPDDLDDQEREIAGLLAGEAVGYRSEHRFVDAGQQPGVGGDAGDTVARRGG